MSQTKTPANAKETKMITSPVRMQQRPMEEDMNPNRRTAVFVGAMFLISTATFILSNALITPLLGSHNFLATVAAHSQLMIVATLIALINNSLSASRRIAQADVDIRGSLLLDQRNTCVSSKTLIFPIPPVPRR